MINLWHLIFVMILEEYSSPYDIGIVYDNLKFFLVTNILSLSLNHTLPGNWQNIIKVTILWCFDILSWGIHHRRSPMLRHALLRPILLRATTRPRVAAASPRLAPPWPACFVPRVAEARPCAVAAASWRAPPWLTPLHAAGERVGRGAAWRLGRASRASRARWGGIGGRERWLGMEGEEGQRDRQGMREYVFLIGGWSGCANVRPV
jgi:hypothetical protein